MTELFEIAVQSARTLPAEMQDEIARVVLNLTGAAEAIYEMSPEEITSIAKSLAEAEAGNFAPEAQVNAVWAKHGL